jgi:hypothetical protein
MCSVVCDFSCVIVMVCVVFFGWDIYWVFGIVCDIFDICWLNGIVRACLTLHS